MIGFDLWKDGIISDYSSKKKKQPFCQFDGCTYDFYWLGEGFSK